MHHISLPYKMPTCPASISPQPTFTMKLTLVLFVLLGLSGMIYGNDCISKKKVNAVIGPILDKRKGLRVTMSPDDLANLVGLKHGRLIF